MDRFSRRTRLSRTWLRDFISGMTCLWAASIVAIFMDYVRLVTRLPSLIMLAVPVDHGRRVTRRHMLWYIDRPPELRSDSDMIPTSARSTHCAGCLYEYGLAAVPPYAYGKADAEVFFTTAKACATGAEASLLGTRHLPPLVAIAHRVCDLRQRQVEQQLAGPVFHELIGGRH